MLYPIHFLTAIFTTALVVWAAQALLERHQPGQPVVARQPDGRALDRWPYVFSPLLGRVPRR